MSRLSLAVVVTALGLAGCGTMGGYRFPQTQDKVPVKVIVAYSEDHPNEVIKSIQEEKLHNGATSYTFVISDGKTPDKVVCYNADGSKVHYKY